MTPWVQDPACYKKQAFACRCAMGQREGDGFCASSGVVEKPLGHQNGGAFLLPEAPGDTEERSHGSLLGKQPVLHRVCAAVVSLLAVLVLALAVALAVRSVGRHGGSPDLPAAWLLACPDGWVGYRKVCYCLSREEGSWQWSQERCASLGASLAVLQRRWEMEFVLRLKGNVDYWLGLQRRGERLEWMDGSSLNHTIPVRGQGECVYLNDHGLVSSSCSQDRPYLCSKAQAVG